MLGETGVASKERPHNQMAQHPGQFPGNHRRFDHFER
jgi:hypothetical protein